MDPLREIARIQDELRYAPLSREGEDVAYAFNEGMTLALREAEAVALRWAAENRTARDRARKVGRTRAFFDGDETQLVMAEQLDGAASECNAIAAEIRRIATEGAA